MWPVLLFNTCIVAKSPGLSVNIAELPAFPTQSKWQKEAPRPWKYLLRSALSKKYGVNLKSQPEIADTSTLSGKGNLVLIALLMKFWCIPLTCHMEAFFFSFLLLLWKFHTVCFEYTHSFSTLSRPNPHFPTHPALCPLKKKGKASCVDSTAHKSWLSFSQKQQLLVSRHSSAKNGVSCPPSLHAGILSGVNLWGSCACFHNPSESCVQLPGGVQKSFSMVTHYLLFFQSFCPLFHTIYEP